MDICKMFEKATLGRLNAFKNTQLLNFIDMMSIVIDNNPQAKVTW